MNKNKFQIGDLVTDKTFDGAKPIEGIGLVIAPHGLMDGWRIYWFKYGDIVVWYEYHLTKLS